MWFILNTLSGHTQKAQETVSKFGFCSFASFNLHLKAALSLKAEMCFSVELI